MDRTRPLLRGTMTRKATRHWRIPQERLSYFRWMTPREMKTFGITYCKVRRILRLEAQAGRMEARQAKARARAELLRRRSDALRTEARAIEGSLTGSQLGELRSVRSGEG